MGALVPPAVLWVFPALLAHPTKIAVATKTKEALRIEWLLANFGEERKVKRAAKFRV